MAHSKAILTSHSKNNTLNSKINPKKHLYILKKISSAKKLKWQTFNTGESFYLNDMKIDTLELRHDSFENVAYKIDDGILKTAYLVDLGKWSDKEVEFCNDADRVLIESYYDENSPRTNDLLDARKRSAYGHLSMQSATGLLFFATFCLILGCQNLAESRKK